MWKPKKDHVVFMVILCGVLFWCSHSSLDAIEQVSRTKSQTSQTTTTTLLTTTAQASASTSTSLSKISLSLNTFQVDRDWQSLSNGILRRQIRGEPWCVPHPQFHKPEFLDWHLNRAMVKSYMVHGENCTDEERALAQTRIGATKCGLFHCDDRHSVGEISIVPNGTYLNDQCGWMTDPTTFLRANQASNVFDVMLLVSSPEGGYFQHFMDGVAPKLAMLHLLRDPALLELVRTSAANRSLVVVLNHPPSWSYLRDALALFGLPNDVRIVFAQKTVPLTARKMINLCLAPPLSPTLWQGVRSLMVANLPTPRRDLIVYTSRSDGAAGNGGRRVLNEESLLKRLRMIVNATSDIDAPISLEVFKSRSLDSLQATIALFQRALIIIGPHGGALTNVFFMQAHSHVVEFFPRNPTTKEAVFWHGCNMFWLMSSMLELQYHQIVATDVRQQSWDMSVDEDEVIGVVTTILASAAANRQAQVQR